MKRVIFMNGKLYYDLIAKREELNRDDVAIIRLEQLYPLKMDKIESIVEKYKGAELFWVQEEPKNMGAWTFLLRYDINHQFTLISRKASASPATGFKKTHFKEQEAIINKAFEA